jgi:hypothetical protein
MEAMKKAGLIIDYKVFRATPKSPDQPNIILALQEVVWGAPGDRQGVGGASPLR